MRKNQVVGVGGGDVLVIYLLNKFYLRLFGGPCGNAEQLNNNGLFTCPIKSEY